MAATKAGYSTARILEKMWDDADFDKPIVTITKEQLMAKCGCGLTITKKALVELRSEGSIKPIKGWQGGRAKPTTWRLCVAGNSTTPADEQVKALEEARARDAAWRYLSGKFGPLKALEIMGDKEEPAE